jgi:hypothetical protein
MMLPAARVQWTTFQQQAVPAEYRLMVFRVDRIEGPVLPGHHVLDDSVSDPADRVPVDLGPVDLRRCARISPVVRPLAYSEITFPVSPSKRRWPLRTVCGSKLLLRPLGTQSSTSPISVLTVLE